MDLFKLTLQCFKYLFIKYFNFQLQVNTGTPQLPDISADKFSVCGSVAMQETPAGYQPQQVQVAIGNQQQVQLDEKSQFCFNVAPGQLNA